MPTEFSSKTWNQNTLVDPVVADMLAKQFNVEEGKTKWIVSLVAGGAKVKRIKEGASGKATSPKVESIETGEPKIGRVKVAKATPSIEQKAKEAAQKKISEKEEEAIIEKTKAEAGISVKTAKEFDAVVNSLKRMGYKTRESGSAKEGAYKIVAINPTTGQPVYIEPSRIALEQMDSTKKKKEQLRKMGIKFAKEPVEFASTVARKEIPETLEVSSAHADIVGTQRRQLQELSSGKHPLIGGQYTGEQSKNIAQTRIQKGAIGTEQPAIAKISFGKGQGFASIPKGKGLDFSKTEKEEV